VKDPIGECVGFRLAATHRRLDRLFNRTYDAIGLGHAHAQILISLLERGSARMTEIAADTGLSQSTVSRLSKELSRHRWVCRKSDPTDGRAQILSPAKRAMGVKPELYRLQRQLNARLRHEIPDADIARLFEVLKLIAPHS